MAVKSDKRVKVSKRKDVPMGKVIIKTTFNNICATVTDMRGRVLCSCSAGVCGFRGSKKSTPYAAQMVATKVAEDAMAKYGLNNVSMYVNGPGNGRDAAMMAFRVAGVKVMRVVDNTTIPHNGCKPRKKRRV